MKKLKRNQENEQVRNESTEHAGFFLNFFFTKKKTLVLSSAIWR